MGLFVLLLPYEDREVSLASRQPRDSPAVLEPAAEARPPGGAAGSGVGARQPLGLASPGKTPPRRALPGAVAGPR